VYLIKFTLLIIDQQGLVDFFKYRALLPIGWTAVQILSQLGGPILEEIYQTLLTNN
jgi:hypothetical protein